MKQWEYTVEELLPAAAGLAEKYTSGESSSVTYETARMLMQTILYWINELEEGTDHMLQGKRMPVEEACRIGHERTLKKVQRARSIYHCIVKEFEDYGCRNYRDTILKGVPEFFRRYDIRFRPSDHLLTLDYPTLGSYGDACGIDLILPYLEDIRVEQKLLFCFDPQSVRELLRKTEEDLDISFMDNLCELVLQQAVYCMAADKEGMGLILSPGEMENARNYFKKDGLSSANQKFQGLLSLLLRQTGAGPEGYFERLGRDFAIRLMQEGKKG